VDVDTEVRDRLKILFADYRDGSDFNFLKGACAPKVERFVTAKNVDPATLVASARQFFKYKRGLSYRPDVKALRVEHVGDTTVAHVPLTMIWGVHTPAEWSPSYAPPPNDGDILDPLEAGLVEHIAVVDVDVTFDASNRITRYLEGPPHQAPLRFVAEEHCLMTDDDPGVPVISVANGAIVTDLGDLYVTQETPKGPQVIRHVRLRGGGDVWVNDHRSWMVQNPAGGTSAAMADCLVPVGDGGK
jgi:hypothetical protein